MCARRRLARWRTRHNLDGDAGRLVWLLPGSKQDLRSVPLQWPVPVRERPTGGLRVERDQREDRLRLSGSLVVVCPVAVNACLPAPCCSRLFFLLAFSGGEWYENIAEYGVRACVRVKINYKNAKETRAPLSP